MSDADDLLRMWKQSYEESSPDYIPSKVEIIKECSSRKILKIHYIGTKKWWNIDPDYDTWSVYRLTFYAGLLIQKKHIGTTRPMALCRNGAERVESLRRLIQEARNIKGEFMKVDISVFEGSDL